MDYHRGRALREMDSIVSIRPLLPILASLLVVPLIMASGRNANLREGWTLTAAGVKFLLVASMLPLVLAGVQIEYIDELDVLILRGARDDVKRVQRIIEEIEEL